MLPKSFARFGSIDENAPVFARFSRTRLLHARLPARRMQKSRKPVYLPFFSRSATIASAAASPTPFMPARP